MRKMEIKKKCLLLLLPACLQLHAQDTTVNKYGLYVITNCKQLQQSYSGNAGKQMVDIKKHIKNIVFDLRYASTNNFMKEKLYPALKTTFLRKIVADSLLKVQQDLNRTGLGLKIFDAYRPYSVTEHMWEIVKDDRYAADPKKGSGHNRGIAIDVTIIKLKTKKELDMGTGFDNFSDTAHHTFIWLTTEILNNRLLLKKTMEAHGFKALETEWWHYHLPAAKEYELLGISFEELMNKKKKAKILPIKFADK